MIKDQEESKEDDVSFEDVPKMRRWKITKKVEF